MLQISNHSAVALAVFQSANLGQRRISSRSALLVLLTLTLLGLSLPARVLAAAVDPYTCDGRYYQTIRPASDFLLYEVETNPVDGTLIANLTANGLPSSNANGSAFNPQDNFIYMAAQTDTGDGEGDVLRVYRIDRNGGVEEVGVPKIAGVAITQSVNAGTILFNGTYIVSSGAAGGRRVFAIRNVHDDLSPDFLVAADLGNYGDGGVGSTGPIIADYAPHPVTGEVFGWDQNDRILVRIDFDDLANPSSVTGTTDIGAGDADFSTAGAAYFTQDGRLIVYGNDTTIPGGQETLASVNVTTGVLTRLGTGPEVNQNDGASCPYSLLLQKTASVLSLSAGDTFYYTFTFVNASAGSLLNVDFADSLSSGFLWSSEPRNLAGGLVIGATALTGSANASFVIDEIPVGTSSFEIEVQVPPVVAITEFNNVAYLTGLPVALGSTVASDDGATATLGDATRTIVTTNDADGDGISDTDEGAGDFDGDGTPDALDRDSDDDGIPDLIEGSADTDLDGILDRYDLDSDNDGIADNLENVSVPPTGLDTDNDGIDDAFDIDITGGFDSNADGIDDALFRLNDIDGDGLPAFRDLDADGDTFPDSIENADYNNDGVSDHLQNPGLRTALDGHGGGAFGPFGLLALLLPLLLRLRRGGLIALSLLGLVAAAELARATDDCGRDIDAGENRCWYAGAGFGVSSLEPDDSQSTWRVTETQSSGFEVHVGRYLTPRWFAEFSYADIGAADVASRNPLIDLQGQIDYRIPSVFVGRVFGDPARAFNLYGKLGVSAIGNSTSDSRIPFDEVTSAQMSLGAGLEWEWSRHWMMRLDASLYDRDAQFLSLSVSRFFGRDTRRVMEPPVEPVAETPVLPPAVESSAELCALFSGSLAGLTFYSDSSELVDTGKYVLDEVARVLVANPQIDVTVRAYTDSDGDDAYNYALSERRARAVLDYLLQKGVDGRRLTAYGHGETDLFYDARGRENKLRSRRVELHSDQVSCGTTDAALPARQAP